jgi:trigger factor
LKESQIKKNYKEIAEKRISIGLLVAEIGRLNKIELDNNDINIALQNEMKRYPGQENEIIKYYQTNAEAMRGLTAPIYEDKVVDYVLSMVNLKDKKITREDLFETKKDTPQKVNTKKNTKKSDKNKEKK